MNRRGFNSLPLAFAAAQLFVFQHEAWGIGVDDLTNTQATQGLSLIHI